MIFYEGHWWMGKHLETSARYINNMKWGMTGGLGVGWSEERTWELPSGIWRPVMWGRSSLCILSSILFPASQHLDGYLALGLWFALPNTIHMGLRGNVLLNIPQKRDIAVNNVYIKLCKLDSLWQNVLESSNDNIIMNVQDREVYFKFSDLHGTQTHGTSIFPHIQTPSKTLF